MNKKAENPPPPDYHKVLQMEVEGAKEPESPQHEGEEDRGWSNKVDFFMASISATIGLGNLWRFPYICYRNGGGAFLLPFIIMMIFVGFPLITMELAIGQFSGKGAVGVWALCPLFQGIGWTMVLMNIICNTYYIMLMAYGIYYLFASFTSHLPWTSCDNVWNTQRCKDDYLLGQDCTEVGGTASKLSLSCANLTVPALIPPGGYVHPSYEYFNNYVLKISDGITDTGGVDLYLALCLLFAWILVVAGLSFGTRSWGKLSYVTAILPYVVMLVLLIRSATSSGAYKGILYYMLPDWSKLARGQVWKDAAVQVFFSTGCCWGNFITIAKHNKLTDNCIRDAAILVIGDLLTSLFCGFVIFSILGQMSFMLGVPISDVASVGPGLAFVVYPQAAAALPAPQFFSAIFFLMLISLGLGSAIPQMANIQVALAETFPKYFSKGLHKFALLASLAGVCFLLGLLYTTNGGIYWLTLVDHYGPSYTLLIIGLFEVLVVSWIYGSGRIQRDMVNMFGCQPRMFYKCLFIFFTICWRVVSPALLLFIFIYSLVDWWPMQFGDYVFPWWAEAVGISLTVLQVILIPAVAIIILIMAVVRRSSLRGLLLLVKPTKDWGRRQSS